MAEERRQLLVSWDEERRGWLAWVPVDLRFIAYAGSESGTYPEGWGLDGVETRDEGLDFTDVAYLDGFDRSEMILRLDRALGARERRLEAWAGVDPVQGLAGLSWPG